jgi:hypothetical protein
MGNRISRRQLLMGSATLGGGLVLAARPTVVLFKP